MKKMEKSELYITLMGVILIVDALFMIGFYIDGLPTSVGGILSVAVAILGGLAAIKYYRQKMIAGVAFCLLIIGLVIILGDFQGMFATDENSNSILSLLYVISGFVLVYYALSLGVGLRTGSIKAIICLGVLGILELFSFLSAVRRGEQITDALWANLLMAIEHAAFIIILTRPEMLIPSFLKRLRGNSDVLFANMVTDPEVFIERKDVDRLTDISDGPEWVHLSNGPIERESVIDIHGRWVATEILLQKWKDDEKLHLTVRTKSNDSYRIALSMVVEQTVLFSNDNGAVSKIRLYGQEGVFADIIVSTEDDIAKGYFGVIKSMIPSSKAKKQQS